METTYVVVETQGQIDVEAIVQLLLEDFWEWLAERRGGGEIG